MFVVISGTYLNEYIYKELFAYKDCRVLFVEGHDQLNLFENVHQEIDEDLWLSLFR